MTAGTTRTYDPFAHRYLIAAGVILGAVMELIDTSIVNVALPDIGANFGATLDELTWVITGYILSAIIVLPMTGWLAARFGRRRYFLTSVAMFTVASFFCGTAGSLVSLVFWRVAPGVEHLYLWIGLVMLAALPLVFLLRRPTSVGMPGH